MFKIVELTLLKTMKPLSAILVLTIVLHVHLKLTTVLAAQTFLFTHFKETAYRNVLMDQKKIK